MNRLAHHQGIDKFFFTLGLTLQLSKPVLKHLVHIVDALTTKGFSGTLTDVHHWVKRYWAVVLLSCVYSIAESRQTLSAGLELLRSRKGHSVVEFIDDAAKQDIPIDVIKKQLHVA
ncbi:hypothetical protein B9L19_14140 [Geobacillus thermocatenulatus]|uniref:Uncharacterized protein n=1 Tax=Geobacillus thermocatenulatus TaxID=33938 RepID=A0AA91TCK6_9BACL|nr:hypothetical protein B9L19_14140 [Geobacillus thermocatenulatus]